MEQTKKSGVSKKMMNEASRGIYKANKRYKKVMKDDRKTLRAVIAQISAGEGEAEEKYRHFLGLPKNANKQLREAVCSWVKDHYLYTATAVIVRVDDDGKEEREEGGIVPVTKNGKIIKDAIDAIEAIMTDAQVRQAQRNAVAKKLRQTHTVCLEKGTLHNEKVLEILLRDANKAPAKYATPGHWGEVEVSK